MPVFLDSLLKLLLAIWQVFLESKYETDFLWKWTIEKKCSQKEIGKDKEEDRIKRIT